MAHIIFAHYEYYDDFNDFALVSFKDPVKAHEYAEKLNGKRDFFKKLLTECIAKRQQLIEQTPFVQVLAKPDETVIDGQKTFAQILEDSSGLSINQQYAKYNGAIDAEVLKFAREQGLDIQFEVREEAEAESLHCNLMYMTRSSFIVREVRDMD